MSFYSDQHQLAAIDLAIAEFRRKSAHPGDTWDHAAKALAYTRSQVKAGTFAKKDIEKPETQLRREVHGVFVQASRR